MIEFVELKVFDFVSYIVDLTEDDERWLTIAVRSRFVVSPFSIVDESSSALNVLASMNAKDVLIISSQSFLSTFETTSSSQSESASIFSSSLTRSKRTIKNSLSLSNDLSEIDRISLDIAEFVDLSRNIDSSNLKVSNIVEEKRVRKSKKIANLAVVSSLDIYSSLDISLIDIVVSKNANSNEIKNIYSTFAVIIKSTRLHRDSLSSSSKLWRDMLRHSHAKDFQKATEFEYQTLIKMSIFTEVFKALNQKLLLLIWMFIYKFDLARFLIRYKARLIVREDLKEVTTEDVYAATLIIKIFRYLMTLTFAFDLQTK
jgi:hypothetical protein